MSFEPGHVVADKYRIVRMIGRGGVGEVYEGENLRIRRKVAIKTLKAEFVAKTDIVQRFEREAQAAGRIGSAHIVEVLDLGDLPDGARFLVMEFLEGETLSRHIKTVGRLAAVDVAQLLIQLLEGLGGAHAAGIVHRDLKPANIYLVPRNGESFVKILDFGVSKFNTLASDELTMTKTGVVVGTPYYMAPEQAKGARTVDGRADLYAVGVIAYECVTGQVPFAAQTFNELLFKIVLEAPPPIEKFVPDIDPSFASVVRKAMSREPNMRFQTAAEFAQALAEWLRAVTGGQLGGDLSSTSLMQGGDPHASTMMLDGGSPMAMPQGAMPHGSGGPGTGTPSVPPPQGYPGGGAYPAASVGGPYTGGGAGMGPNGWTASGAGFDPPVVPVRSPLPLLIGAAIGLVALVGGTITLVRWGDGDAGKAVTAATAVASSAAATSAEPPRKFEAPPPPASAIEAEPVASGGAPTASAAPDGFDEDAKPTTAAPRSRPPTTSPPTSRPPSRPPTPPPATPLPGRPPGTSKPGAGRPISGDL